VNGLTHSFWQITFALAVWWAADALAPSVQAAPAPLKQSENPQIKAPAALVVDWSNGKVLYEREADVVRPIASLSKMFAALFIYEECRLDPDAYHLMSPENRKAARGGDHSKLTTGWKYTHRDLMYAALMRSDNRAFPALAEACGLTPQEMGVRMTARARSMGLVNTRFEEPTGLSPQNVSTPREVMLMLEAVVKRPEIAAIMSTRRYVVTGVDKNGRMRRHEMGNTDRLVMNRELPVIAGKTGYTDLARYCLAIALRSSLTSRLGVVVMGAEGKLTRFADVRRILRWLDSNQSVATTIGTESSDTQTTSYQP
jgi:D-alanyl-D-alanine endopeptidase (penicillin-binding protein 7)